MIGFLLTCAALGAICAWADRSTRRLSSDDVEAALAQRKIDELP